MEYERQVPYAEFRQACRAYRASELLPFLAKYSARLHGIGPLDTQKLRSVAPWDVAVVARECLLWGNDHRARPVNDRVIPRLFNLLRSVVNYGPDPEFSGIVVPILNDQMTLQGNPHVDAARAIAILGTAWGDFAEYDWTPAFGMSLPKMVRATEFLAICASKNDGRVDLDAFWDSEIERRLLPRSEVELALRFLTRTPNQHREHARAAGVLSPESGQYDYNPLRTSPFVDFGPNVGIIAPEPRLVGHSISITNLYFEGPKHFGSKAFHTSLGDRIESYVGRQLDLIPGADVFGELPMNHENAMSIDWFVVLPEVIVLVECKSARLNAKALAGDVSQIRSSVDRYIVKGRRQIDATAAAIRSGEKRLARVPNDHRPVVGLVVTAETIPLANSGLPEYGEQGAVPSMVASIAELEGLVSLPPGEVGPKLLEVFTDKDRRTWGFGLALGVGRDSRRNPIIDAASDRAAFIDRRLEDG